MRRGEVWLINLNPTIGAEIKKTCPPAGETFRRDATRNHQCVSDRVEHSSVTGGQRE